MIGAIPAVRAEVGDHIPLGEECWGGWGWVDSREFHEIAEVFSSHCVVTLGEVSSWGSTVFPFLIMARGIRPPNDSIASLSLSKL